MIYEGTPRWPGSEGDEGSVHHEKDVCIGEVSGYAGSCLTRPKASYHFLVVLHFRLCPLLSSFQIILDWDGVCIGRTFGLFYVILRDLTNFYARMAFQEGNFRCPVCMNMREVLTK